MEYCQEKSFKKEDVAKSLTITSGFNSMQDKKRTFFFKKRNFFLLTKKNIAMFAASLIIHKAVHFARA